MTRDEQATALDFPAAGSVTGIAIRWWFGPQRASVTREAAEEAIRGAAEARDYPDAVGDEDALERLVTALTDNLWAWTRHAEEEWQRRIPVEELGHKGSDWQKLADELDAGGVFWLDELAAAWLERSGKAGGQAAAKLRTEAQERADVYRAQEELPLVRPDVWLVHTGERDEQGNEVVRFHSGSLSALHPEAMRARAELVSGGGEPHRPWRRRRGGPWPVFAAWLPKDGERVPLFGKRLAWALWLDEVGPTWAERAKRAASSRAPAWVGHLAFPFARLSDAAQLDGAKVTVRGRDTGLALALAPAVDARALEGLRGLDKLHTLTAQRTVYELARVAWLCWVEGGKVRGDGWHARRGPDGSTHLVVEGGDAELAALVGETSTKRRSGPWEVLEALTYLHVSRLAELTQERGTLVSRTFRVRGNQHQAGRLEATLSTWWAPGVVHRLPSTERLLVPVLPVPPLDAVGPRVRAKVAAVEQLAVVRLAEQSRDYARLGGYALPWEQLAAEVGVAFGNVAPALEDWTERGRWAHDGRLWRLGEGTDETHGAHLLLTEGGERRAEASAAGQRSAAKRRRKVKDKGR